MRRSDGARASAVIEGLLSDLETYSGSAVRDLARLWRTALARHTPAIVAGTLLTLVWALLPFVFALTWRYLVDGVLMVGGGRAASDLGPEQFDHQVRCAILFFSMNMGLWTIWIVTHWTRSYLIQRVGRHLVFELRKLLHEKLQSLPISYFERNPTGRILSRVLDDVNVVHQWVTTEAVNIFANISKLIVGIGLIAYLNWKLSIIVAAAIPAYAWIFKELRPRIRRASIARRRNNARMYGRASERVAAVTVVKTFAREKAETAAFARMAHDDVRIGMKIVLYNQGLMLLAGLITAVASGAIVYVGVTQVQTGALTLGSVMAFLQAMHNIFEPVNMLTGTLAQVQETLVVIRRVFMLLDEKVEMVPGHIVLEGMEGTVQFDGVTFSYPGQALPALSDVSFRTTAGERIALMGPSGAGKSTVFQLLLRFYDPQKGSVRVGGVELVNADPRSVRRHVCMVQQEPTVFSGTIADNIMYGNLDASPAQIMRAAEHADLHDFVMSLQLRYDTEVGENGITLSGGQKQRLALAAALLTEPEVLLLDDTTSALDAETETRIRSTLNRVLKGRTSLIITQRVATARDCDRIIVLERGRITQQGAHDELMAAEGFYRHICQKQAVLAP
jgi:ABC-type multidrug transport system fused ATPase/permease subunit